jgi:subtilisin family serine protease
VGVSDDDVLPSPDVPQGGQPYAAGHATFVTGLVLRQAPAATVRVQKVLEPTGDAKSWDVAKAIVEIGRSGIQILNLSLVCYTGDGKPPLGLATAIDRLDPEILVVACAGNHGDRRLEELTDDDHRQPAWPAALDDVVAVGSAVRSSDGASPPYRLCDFTPWDAVWIDVVTHGEGVRSTYFTGTGSGVDPQGNTSQDTFDGGAEWSGTSFSAALLAGHVAAVATRKKISVRAVYHDLMEHVSPGLVTADGARIPPFLDLELPPASLAR